MLLTDSDAHHDLNLGVHGVILGVGLGVDLGVGLGSPGNTPGLASATGLLGGSRVVVALVATSGSDALVAGLRLDRSRDGVSLEQLLLGGSERGAGGGDVLEAAELAKLVVVDLARRVSR